MIMLAILIFSLLPPSTHPPTSHPTPLPHSPITNQIIGVADTGMDPKVCFLSDTNAVPYNSISISHRKVVTYITFADNQVRPSVGRSAMIYF